MSNSASSSPRDGIPNIVFDLGTDRIRAGQAGSETPTVDIPAVTGHAKHQGLVASVSGARSSFIGHDALQKRAILNLKYPIEKGVIHDWNDMERILQYTMTKELNVNPAEYGVLFSEPPLNPRDSRETLLHLMFESFQSPRVYLANSALLSLISVGRETGVVIHVGEQISHIVPIYEGYALNASTRTIPLGGSHLTNHLLTTLAKTHPLSVTSSSDHDIIRDIKEKKCYVASHYEREMKTMCEKKDEENYTLPDGRSITLSSERITIPEILFQPRLMGMSDHDTLGLHHLTHRVIESCDSSLHRTFYGAILPSGATCYFDGFNDRMITELNHLTPTKLNYITDDNHMTLSTYIGGSILASLQSFHSMWITQAEYLEQGDRIVHRKCF